MKVQHASMEQMTNNKVKVRLCSKAAATTKIQQKQEGNVLQNLRRQLFKGTFMNVSKALLFPKIP